MHFHIDADLPRRMKQAIESFAHYATDVRDIGMRRAKDPEIAAHAKAHGLCLASADWGFADIRRFPPEQYRGIVILGLPEEATGEQTVAVMRVLLAQPLLVDQLPGHLAIVENNRIRFRPAL